MLILLKMAEKQSTKCGTILAEFLDENMTLKLKETFQDNDKARMFLRDLYDTICDGFPSDFEQGNEILGLEEVGNATLLDVALRISAFFPSCLVLQTSAECLKEVKTPDKDVQCWKICKILTEIVKNCSYEWIIGFNTQEKKIIETSDLEKSSKHIVELLLSLLKLINLMPLKLEQLRNNPKLNLFPRILQLCLLILEKSYKNSNGVHHEAHGNFMAGVLNKVLCEFVMTCIQQIGNQNWVLDECRGISMKVLEFLRIMCGCQNIDELLFGKVSITVNDDPKNVCLFPSGLLGKVLERMKMFMIKDKLPDSPAAIQVLVWSITKVKHPALGEHLSMILPPLLLLVDDYHVENRVTGIKTLSHVIENTNSTELCWYGRADIIYDALHHRIHTNEPQVMQVLQPCLLRIIQVIEPSPKKAVASRKTNRCDENFQIILTAMEYESKILMRRAYCSNLALVVEHMGITVVRHFKRLLRVICGYLEIGDGDSEQWRVVMLDVLKSLILNAWPRVPNHKDDILKCLMKLIIDVSMSSPATNDVKDSMFVKIEECLLVLLCVCGESVKKQLRCMTNVDHKETEVIITKTLDLYESDSHVNVNKPY